MTPEKEEFLEVPFSVALHCIAGNASDLTIKDGCFATLGVRNDVIRMPVGPAELFAITSDA